MKVTIDKDVRGQPRFNFVGDNGEIVAQSEGYHNLGDCLSTIVAIRMGAATATLPEEFAAQILALEAERRLEAEAKAKADQPLPEEP